VDIGHVQVVIGIVVGCEGYCTSHNIGVILNGLATIDTHTIGLVKMTLKVFVDVIGSLLDTQQDIIHMLHRAIERLFGITESLILQGLT
jgi:hypothetical protein